MEPLYALLADIARRVRRLLPVLTINLATAMLLALIAVLVPDRMVTSVLRLIETGLSLGTLGFLLAVQLFACAVALVWQGLAERRSPTEAPRAVLLDPLVDFSLALVMVAGSYLLAFALALKLRGYGCEARDVMLVITAVVALGVVFVALPTLAVPNLRRSRRALSGWSACLVGAALALALFALPDGESLRLDPDGTPRKCGTDEPVLAERGRTTDQAAVWNMATRAY